MGSVVNKSTDENKVYAGVPARIIKEDAQKFCNISI